MQVEISLKYCSTRMRVADYLAAVSYKGRGWKAQAYLGSVCNNLSEKPAVKVDGTY